MKEQELEIQQKEEDFEMTVQNEKTREVNENVKGKINKWTRK